MFGLCRSVLSITTLKAKINAVSGLGKTDPFCLPKIMRHGGSNNSGREDSYSVRVRREERQSDKAVIKLNQEGRAHSQRRKTLEPSDPPLAAVKVRRVEE